MILVFFIILLGFFFASITILMVKERNRLAKYKGLPPSTRAELLAADEKLRRQVAEQKGNKYVAPPTNPEAGSLVFGVLTFVCFAFGISKLINQDSKPTQVSTQAKAPAELVEPRPSILPSTFQVFRHPNDAVVIPFVVPLTATDDQIAALLWHIRDDVQSHSFKELGLTQSDEIEHSGLIAIYRGSKCATEGYSIKMPCGDDDHSAAHYQWGIDQHSEKDAAAFVLPDGKERRIFDSQDGYKLPPALQAHLDKETQDRKAAAEAEKLEQTMFAQLLDSRVKSMGYHMDIFPGPEQGQLMLSSSMFDEDAGRVTFLSSILPQWKRELCKVGFTSVRLSSGVFSLGDSYSVGCTVR